MVYVIQETEQGNEIGTIRGFSDSIPQSGDYFEISEKLAKIIVKQTDENHYGYLQHKDHKMINLSNAVEIGSSNKAIGIRKGLAGLILHATTNLEEAQKDLEKIEEAQRVINEFGNKYNPIINNT